MNRYKGIPTNFSHNPNKNSDNRHNSVNYSAPDMNQYNPRHQSLNYGNPYNQPYITQNTQQPNNSYPQQINFNNNSNNNGFGMNALARQLIMQYADKLFIEFDKNRSGFLDVKEMYNCITKLYSMQGRAPPNYKEVIDVMKEFDDDRNGLIDMAEFRNILLKLSGNT